MTKLITIFIAAIPLLMLADNDVDAFRDARFGMFIHWGLFAQLGGQWKGRAMDVKIGEWAQSYFEIPNSEYSQLAGSFNPVNFNADEWARQAKDAGCEYVVFTTKHHEGFSMFETKVSDYNVVDATPFGRDVFREVADAFRRQGIKIGIYYSQNLDWHEADGGDPRSVSLTNYVQNADLMHWGNVWDFPDCSKKDLNRYLKDKVYPQIKELLCNYGDIFLVWFDTPLGMTKSQSKDLREYVRSFQPHTLVNSRIGNGCGDFGSMGDNKLVTNKCDFVRESAITLNDTWGFRFDDHNWKSPNTIAEFLAQNLSRNANILMNVGPRPDGRLPDASSDILAALGRWRRESHFEIKGVGPNPFNEEFPWGWCMIAPGDILQIVVKRDWKGDVSLAGTTVRVPEAPTLMPRVIRRPISDFKFKTYRKELDK